MDPKNLARIERNNYVIGVILVVAAFAMGSREQFLGMVCGVGLSCLNFSFIRRLVEHLVNGPEENRSKVAALFIPKMGALMAAAAAVIYFLPVDGLAFAAGFSVFLASITVESARFILNPPKPSADDASESGKQANGH